MVQTKKAKHEQQPLEGLSKRAFTNISASAIRATPATLLQTEIRKLFEKRLCFVL